MNPRIKKVKPGSDYTLTLVFTNNEVRVFDVKPYLSLGVFRELSNPSIFKKVRPFMGTVQWKHGQDFCPDTLYMKSKPLRSTLKHKHNS